MSVATTLTQTTIHALIAREHLQAPMIGIALQFISPNSLAQIQIDYGFDLIAIWYVSFFPGSVFDYF